jgi:DNA polymerase III subunit beta
MNASAGVLKATGYDLELGITSAIEASVETAGSVVVPYRTLLELTSRMEATEAISLAIDGTQLRLTSTSGSYSLTVEDAADYPQLPAVAVSDDYTDLSALAAVLPAASSDAAKQVLTGVHMHAALGNLRMAATDGHRLSIVNIESTALFSAIIPARCLALIKQPAAIAFDNQHVSLTFVDGTTIISRTLAGTYPNVQQLIPETFDYSITINRVQLLNALQRVAVIGTNVIKLDAQSKTLTLSAEVDANSGIESISITGSLPLLAFNPIYLIDGLRSFHSDTVTINANSSVAPVILTNPADLSQTYLIMPVQVRT